MIAQVSQEMFSGNLLSISIGTAYYPEDGADAAELLSVADRRLYSEKHSHREQASESSRAVRERDVSGNVLVH